MSDHLTDAEYIKSMADGVGDWPAPEIKAHKARLLKIAAVLQEAPASRPAPIPLEPVAPTRLTVDQCVAIVLLDYPFLRGVANSGLVEFAKRVVALHTFPAAPSAQPPSADAARLDWLLSNLLVAHFRYPHVGTMAPPFTREGIDAAMGETHEQG